jgi:beta-glucosidase
MRDELSFFSEEIKKWVFEPGKFEILVGSSSRDIRLKEVIDLD